MKTFLERVEENEKTERPVVMAFGRMNPPTIGHEKLVNHVKNIAKDYNAPHHIIISHSTDSKKNPLEVTKKVKHAKRFFPGSNIYSSSKEAPSFIQHASKLYHSGHDHLVMVAGSDRVDEYEKTLNRYNGPHEGALFNFKKIEVKSAGQRDPDAEGVEGMSASKMREHAKNNDFMSFKQGVPAHVPEAHAKELFRDVRTGMGIHENVNHGKFKAIFVTGGPGSGKDIIIRECVPSQKIVEMNAGLAISILNDKHRLHESSSDYRREAMRNRNPLIINGTTNDQYMIVEIKNELEELGYETLMVFVNTSNDSSKQRNEKHARVLEESVRFERWKRTQTVSESLKQSFNKYFEFDNSIDLNEATEFEKYEKEEDLTIMYEMINWFLDIEVENEIANSWLLRNKKININNLFEQAITGENYVSKNKTDRNASITKEQTCSCTKGGKTSSRLFGGRPREKGQRLLDNICPSCQLVRKQGRADSVTDGDVASNSSYIFRTYVEGRASTSAPTLQQTPQPKETRFQQDADKIKAKKQKTSNAEAGKVLKPAGVSSEYDTRGSGTVYPMSGLGMVTYREQKENKYTSAAEVSTKSFRKFRKEAIDSPSPDMGVTGTAHGPTNKEPMETLNKIETNPPIKKKKR
jgi:predicted kinase